MGTHLPRCTPRHMRQQRAQHACTPGRQKQLPFLSKDIKRLRSFSLPNSMFLASLQGTHMPQRNARDQTTQDTSQAPRHLHLYITPGHR